MIPKEANTILIPKFMIASLILSIRGPDSRSRGNSQLDIRFYSNGELLSLGTAYKPCNSASSCAQPYFWLACVPATSTPPSIRPWTRIIQLGSKKKRVVECSLWESSDNVSYLSDGIRSTAIRSGVRQLATHRLWWPSKSPTLWSTIFRL